MPVACVSRRGITAEGRRAIAGPTLGPAIGLGQRTAQTNGDTPSIKRVERTSDRRSWAQRRHGSSDETKKPIRIVLSGCSGAGKSTLIEEMARRGWPTVAEPGRRIVRAAKGPDDPTLPWNDIAAFCRAAIDMAIADHQAATAGVTLFDRSLIDALTGLTRAGHPADKTLAETHRYDAVYLAPPWPDLFEADDERPHRFEDALAEYEALQQSYPSYGYTVIDLPQAPLPQRADWWEADLAERIAA